VTVKDAIFDLFADVIPRENACKWDDASPLCDPRLVVVATCRVSNNREIGKLRLTRSDSPGCRVHETGPKTSFSLSPAKLRGEVLCPRKTLCVMRGRICRFLSRLDRGGPGHQRESGQQRDRQLQSIVRMELKLGQKVGKRNA
jgi:hypothetical protein